MNTLATRFRNEVFLPYCDLLKAQYKFHPKFFQVKEMWGNKLTEKELIKGPYMEKSQIYANGDSPESLKLHQDTINIINNKLKGRTLWKHQTDALNLSLNDQNAVIATGTSSGKTLCYQIPIIDDLIRNSLPGLRAIIIYPLNALVNDQLNEWENLLQGVKNITFARFTGQTPISQKEYEDRLKSTLREQLADEQLTEMEKQREINKRLEARLHHEKTAIPNRLNHREAIRKNPPNILITNFSMLEYLLERPVDAPIFEKSRLKFLVLDEVHAYRGIQATEIAFLIRRLKNRLRVKNLSCIATSATLGKKEDPESRRKVREFASDLFCEDFPEPNPIYGNSAKPKLEKPSFRPTADQYIKAAESLRKDEKADVRANFGINESFASLSTLLNHDENLYHLRDEILVQPILLSNAAKRLWPNDPLSFVGLQALLEIVGIAKKDGSHEDLLPTRLHYFVRAQDGLHICLHKQCPGRNEGKPAFFVSRKNDQDTPEGYCPECYRANQKSKLVELVSCRKCGYVFGALQDLGPRRAQNPETDDQQKQYFDSFSTELGWAADSFWSYFSIDEELPYPDQPKVEDEDDPDDLFIHPIKIDWCVICGKKSDKGAGDNCNCQNPHLRNIKIFHRQCRPTDFNNLINSEKTLLNRCPNCGARNVLGLEPLRRFQESDDETGLAIAIPLAHFQVSPPKGNRPPRKLLCFTDNRQRAAAFPSLLEEETFEHDMGRMIVKNINQEPEPMNIMAIGERLAELADPQSNNYNPDFFLPVSRFPDEELNAKDKRNLWIAEVLSYVGIPDSARESAEDLGLVAVKYLAKEEQVKEFYYLLKPYDINQQEASDLLQVLLGFMRHRKAFTLPKGIDPDATAFGRVSADIGYILRREGIKSTIGWLPHLNKDGSYRDNQIVDYLRRVLCLERNEVLNVSEKIWNYLVAQLLVEGKNGKWQLDHERIYIEKSRSRYICKRCRIPSTFSIHQCCPHKGCNGQLESQPFGAEQENIIARWIAGTDDVQFTTLKSEEHTAQINKELAKKIEEDFRAEEGVNLLSSTTTFELGINIGDLQKVLLRNAPPSSTSYVQRVGRAGRGEDKNSICVTLCRRTKYDADAWSDPTRLMSGEIKAPTVFIQNKVVSQRHLNASVFAEYLRIKLVDEHALGGVTQKIRLEAFLPGDVRKQIPLGWSTTNVFLDFLQWLEQKDHATLVKGFGPTSWPNGKNIGSEIRKAAEIYKNILSKIAEDLTALLEERKKLFDRGIPVGEIEKSIRNLLDSDIIAILSKRGFLPRYAFPLDVVSLETGLTRWSRDTEVELSRDRGIAIAEFAPGAQVIAHKKVFTSSGLYVVSRSDRPERLWYVKCRGCGQIRTGPTQDQLKGKCNVCGKSLSMQDIKAFVEPTAFSIRIDKKRENSARHRRSTLIRQKQTLTHFIDVVPDDDFKDVGLFHIAVMHEGKLFRYNLGPGNYGFRLCPSCGCSEPAHGSKSGTKHKRLRPSAGIMDCDGQFYPKPLAYGHEFKSICLVFSFRNNIAIF